ncbi:MAG: HPF/RaiA family ribosome-associated protein [Phycisphaerae bacterium]
MELRVFVRGVEQDKGLREYAQSKVSEGLARYDSHVLSGTVRLEDETGPAKDAVDKVCSIELKLRGSEVRVREVGAEFHAVIDVALDRARAALGRQISKNKRGVGEG